MRILCSIQALERAHLNKYCTLTQSKHGKINDQEIQFKTDNSRWRFWPLLAAAFYFYNNSGTTGDGENLAGVSKIAADEHILGSKDAPLTVIVYASMTCSHCANFHNNIFPAIKKKYIDTGKVRLVFREFPVSNQDMRSIAAFMLARCADEEKYFPMVDLMFKKQDDWARAEDPTPVLLNIAKFAGFTQESFNACLKNQAVMDTVLAVKNEASDNYDVSGTPTFFIDGEKQVGVNSVEEFSKLIEDAM